MNEPAQRQQEFPTGYTDLPRNTFVWLGESGKGDTLGQGVEGGREKTLITKEGMAQHKSLLLGDLSAPRMLQVPDPKVNEIIKTR